MAEEWLYVVYVEDPETALETAETPAMKALGAGLYLVRSADTQSRLYHDVKHATRPKALFVGRLDDDPKFKGMAEGALKWLREGA